MAITGVLSCRLAGVGNRQDHIAACHHAQVTVAGLGRMQEERRGPGAGQRGGNLVAYMARLAHAGDHHPAGCGKTEAAGCHESGIDSCAQFGDRPRLDLEGAATRRDQRRTVACCVHVCPRIIA
jgi:hypothetical protein